MIKIKRTSPMSCFWYHFWGVRGDLKFCLVFGLRKWSNRLSCLCCVRTLWFYPFNFLSLLVSPFHSLFHSFLVRKGCRKGNHHFLVLVVHFGKWVANGYFTLLYSPIDSPKGPKDIEALLMGKVISLLMCLSSTCSSAPN